MNKTLATLLLILAGCSTNDDVTATWSYELTRGGPAATITFEGKTGGVAEDALRELGHTFVPASGIAGGADLVIRADDQVVFEGHSSGGLREMAEAIRSFRARVALEATTADPLAEYDGFEEEAGDNKCCGGDCALIGGTCCANGTKCCSLNCGLSSCSTCD